MLISLRRYDDIVVYYYYFVFIVYVFRTVNEKAQRTLDIKPLTLAYVYGTGTVWYMVCRRRVYVCFYMCVRAPLYWLYVHVYNTCVGWLVGWLTGSLVWLVSICVYAIHQIYNRFSNSFDCQLPNFSISLWNQIGNFQINSIDCQEMKSSNSSSKTITTTAAAT